MPILVGKEKKLKNAQYNCIFANTTCRDPEAKPIKRKAKSKQLWHRNYKIYAAKYVRYRYVLRQKKIQLNKICI